MTVSHTGYVHGCYALPYTFSQGEGRETNMYLVFLSGNISLNFKGKSLKLHLANVVWPTMVTSIKRINHIGWRGGTCAFLVFRADSQEELQKAMRPV